MQGACRKSFFLPFTPAEVQKVKVNGIKMKPGGEILTRREF